MRLRRAMTLAAGMAAAAAVATGCGDSGSSGSSSHAVAPSRPAPPKSAFPSASGKTLAEVMKAAEPSELVVSPAATVFYRGGNRYPVAVSKRDGGQINDAEIALYLAKAPQPTQGRGAAAGTQRRALDSPAFGPYPLAIESLAAKPAFRARTTPGEAKTAAVVYVTHLDFPSNGEWRVAALVRQGGKLVATLLPSAVVGEFHDVPRVGQKAPLTHTPTAADVGGDLSKLTTRTPPETQNRVDYADVLGKKPILLLFATPRFCQSRVCGPVVDVAEQLKQAYGDEVEFIHMEIYKNNDPNAGVRPQVRDFNLPTEPWAFAIDRNGIVRAEIEGSFGVEALTAAVRKAVQG